MTSETGTFCPLQILVNVNHKSIQNLLCTFACKDQMIYTCTHSCFPDSCSTDLLLSLMRNMIFCICTLFFFFLEGPYSKHLMNTCVLTELSCQTAVSKPLKHMCAFPPACWNVHEVGGCHATPHPKRFSSEHTGGQVKASEGHPRATRVPIEVVNGNESMTPGSWDVKVAGGRNRALGGGRGSKGQFKGYYVVSCHKVWRANKLRLLSLLLKRSTVIFSVNFKRKYLTAVEKPRKNLKHCSVAYMYSMKNSLTKKQGIYWFNGEVKAPTSISG